jgi:hypothetical protein
MEVAPHASAVHIGLVSLQETELCFERAADAAAALYAAERTT